MWGLVVQPNFFPFRSKLVILPCLHPHVTPAHRQKWEEPFLDANILWALSVIWDFRASIASLSVSFVGMEAALTDCRKKRLRNAGTIAETVGKKGLPKIIVQNFILCDPSPQILASPANWNSNLPFIRLFFNFWFFFSLPTIMVRSL